MRGLAAAPAALAAGTTTFPSAATPPAFLTCRPEFRVPTRENLGISLHRDPTGHQNANQRHRDKVADHYSPPRPANPMNVSDSTPASIKVKAVP